MADLQVILSSGEIVEMYIRDTGEPNRVLRKEEIEALISDLQVSLGNYSFDGDEMSVSGDRVLNASGAITTLQSVQDDGGYGYLRLSEDYIAILYNSGTSLNTFRMDETGAQFLNVTIAMIDAAGTKSVTTKEWSLDKFFQKDEFINVFTGQSGVPILTSSTGKIDTSLLSVSIGELQGNFTPTAGTEYPDITGMVAGDYWIIEGVGGVGSGYTFTGGQLSGQTIYDNAWMQLDTNLLWVISNNSGGTNVQWGGIFGSLPNQTDLVNYVSDQFGNYTFDGDLFLSNGKQILEDEGADLTINPNQEFENVGITGDSIIIDLSDAQIDAAVLNSAITKGWTESKLSDKADNSELALKANQSALDDTNLLVGDNTTAITQNTSDIAMLKTKIADYQADSTATSMGALVADFNSLLSKLKASGLMANS